jgi:hypothetical protein
MQAPDARMDDDDRSKLNKARSPWITCRTRLETAIKRPRHSVRAHHHHLLGLFMVTT